MLYLKREDIDPDSVIDLATYIRSEQMSLFDISDEAILDGRISWEDPPLWVEKDSQSEVVGTDRVPQSIWEEVIANNGKVYYWNTRTGETQWSKPEDFGNVDEKKQLN